MRGWPGFAGMEPEAAAGARGFAGPALRLTNEGAEALEELYGSRQAQRMHAHDPMVTGAAPATSPRGGGCC